MRRITFILQMARDKKGFFAFSFLPFILSLNLISDSVRLSHIKQFLIITEINWFCCCCCFSCSCFSLLFYRLGKGFWYPGIYQFQIILYFHLAVHLGLLKEDHVSTLLWLVVAGRGALLLTKLVIAVIVQLFVFNLIQNFYHFP